MLQTCGVPSGEVAGAPGQEASPFFIAFAGDRCLSPSRLATLVGAMQEVGVPIGALLEGTGLSPGAVADPATLTSCAQFMRVSRNALRLSARSDLGLLVGTRLRASSYGMYGYALLCSETVAQMWDLAVRCHPLSGGMLPLHWGREGAHAVWTFPTRAAFPWADVDERLYRFMIDLQLAAHVTIGKDVMGDWFLPEWAECTGPRPPHADALRDRLGCEVRFGAARNALVFPAAWLTRSPQLANPITASHMAQHCMRLMDELRRRAGVTRQVCDELTRTPGRFPDIETVSQRLCMSSRTLRRRLEDEGVTYSELLASVRKSLASDYLLSTRMGSDDIAAALGFSDAESFRHAFKRWTGLTPRAFRERAGGRAAVAQPL